MNFGVIGGVDRDSNLQPDHLWDSEVQGIEVYSCSHLQDSVHTSPITHKSWMEYSHIGL